MKLIWFQWRTKSYKRRREQCLKNHKVAIEGQALKFYVKDLIC